MKVLLIEDNVHIAKNIITALEHIPVLVTHATNGSQGLDIALTSAYDLYIIDRMLPEIDGLTICKTLRRHNIRTPILFLTALGDTKEVVEGLDAGADDYLGKPFALAELLARIRSLVRRPITAIAEHIAIDTLVIDTTLHTVSRSGTEILLTRREYDLLIHLARSQGIPQSKEVLINTVWPYDTDVLPNTVEVYIKKLRHKIDDPFPDVPPIIHTIRGVGYVCTKK